MAMRFNLFPTAYSANVFFVFIICIVWELFFQHFTWICSLEMWLQLLHLIQLRFLMFCNLQTYAKNPNKTINSHLGEVNVMFNSPVGQCVYVPRYGDF